MIAIIDYDAGNMKSVEKALDHLGAERIVTGDPDVIRSADKVILPGVGSFGSAMEKLVEHGLDKTVKEVANSGTPLLGICLGLQMLFDSSEEAPGVPGLSILPGKILKFSGGGGLKVPHMGWNSLTFPKEGRLFCGIDPGSFVYFVHSYYLRAENESDVAATCEYGVKFHASVERGNIFGCQFHPEKSSETGLKILENFIALKGRDDAC